MSSSPRLKLCYRAPSSSSPLALEHGALAAVQARHQRIRESRGGDRIHLAEHKCTAESAISVPGLVAAQARNSLEETAVEEILA